MVVQIHCLLCSSFFDGYCSTVQGLLDWFEVDLGFTELSSIQTHMVVQIHCLLQFLFVGEEGLCSSLSGP